MVATVVVASAGAMLYGGFFQISRMQLLHERQMAAVRVLANRLAVVEEAAPGLSLSSACEPPYEDMTWSLTASATRWPSVAQVTLALSWPLGAEGSSDGRLEMVTFRPVPEPPP